MLNSLEFLYPLLGTPFVTGTAAIYGYGNANGNENVWQSDCNNLPSGRWWRFVFPVAFNAIVTAVSASRGTICSISLHFQGLCKKLG